MVVEGGGGWVGGGVGGRGAKSLQGGAPQSPWRGGALATRSAINRDSLQDRQPGIQHYPSPKPLGWGGLVVVIASASTHIVAFCVQRVPRVKRESTGRVVNWEGRGVRVRCLKM